MDAQGLKKEFAKILDAAVRAAYPQVKLGKAEILASITIPKAELGDLSSAISFSLAKQAKAAPFKISENLARIIIEENLSDKKGMIKKIENANGYLNLWFDEAKYGKLVLDAIINKGKEYGSSSSGKGKRVIVEFPSVNPNKPWHIGHLRNALLGDSISNLLLFNSYLVEREDYIDDLGLQMAEILWGAKHLAGKSNIKYDRFLGEQYVKINKEIAEKKAEEAVNNILKKMEDTKSKESAQIREISEKSVMAQYQTAFDYGIYHDVMIWESDIVRNDLLSKAMALLEDKRITKVPTEGKYKGCVVVETDSKDVREGEENIKVFIRSNGVATYIAKDLAFHMWKLGMLKAEFRYTQFAIQPNGKSVFSSSKSGDILEFGGADIAINIIGSAQQYPQNVLKEVFKAISGKDGRIIHVSYGEVSMKEGTLSGREGGWIGEERNYTADDLLKEMNQKTLEVVKNSEKIKDKANEAEIARKVALSAIKFEFLRIDPDKKVMFDWDSALDLNANSGPYCMYMYARASRILEKAELGPEGPALKAGDYAKIGRSYDFELIRLLGMAGEKVEKACREYRPNVIADYLIDLSQLFSSFYENMPVLKGEGSKAVRVAIVFATKQVIYNMLTQLGIQTAENM